MKKIIHLSDTHIGHQDCGSKFSTIIDNISFLKQPAHNYVIIITGDLADNGNRPDQCDEAAQAVRKLEKKGYRVLVVPGNHDYGTGTMGNIKNVRLFKKRLFNNPDLTYPKLDVIDEMAFIGLDSSAGELNWYDRVLAQGELGSKQLERLDNILGDKAISGLKKIVYLHHHPFDFKLGRQLKDSNNLRSIIENRIDVLLFGHYHRSRISAGKIFHGVWGIPRCYNAGTSTHKNGNPGFHRVIDLSHADPRMDYDGCFI